MFIIIDGNMKLFGVFDGYGPKGHLVSAFAQSKFVEYLTKKGSNKKFFEPKNLREKDDKAIEIQVRKAFKYVQKELKQQYKYFVEEKREEVKEQKQ